MLTERHLLNITVLLTGCAYLRGSCDCDYLIARCRQLLPSIILQKVLEFADVLSNSRIVSCDGLMEKRLWLKKVGMPDTS